MGLLTSYDPWDDSPRYLCCRLCGKWHQVAIRVVCVRPFARYSTTDLLNTYRYKIRLCEFVENYGAPWNAMVCHHLSPFFLSTSSFSAWRFQISGIWSPQFSGQKRIIYMVVYIIYIYVILCILCGWFPTPILLVSLKLWPIRDRQTTHASHWIESKGALGRTWDLDDLEVSKNQQLTLQYTTRTSVNLLSFFNR